MNVTEVSTLFCGPRVLRKESKILKQLADQIWYVLTFLFLSFFFFL
jgi:hypothetical protein